MTSHDQLIRLQDEKIKTTKFKNKKAMECFEDYKKIPQSAKNAVIVIGNFDGLHLGHQALLNEARAIANKLGRPLGLLTFEPHPRRLFHPDEPPNRLTPKAQKAKRLKANGVNFLYSLPFDWDFASQTADDFIQNILIKSLNATHIIVGFDFKFGQLRKGTPETIKSAGLNVTVLDEIKGKNNENYSSSHVRQLIRHGKIEQANAILGWDWEITGTVFKGDQRGRELGYPTANMKLDEYIHPAYGIYACFARLDNEDNWMMGATNIGIRPMFEVPTAQVETFIFDFDKEIYGERLHIRPVQRLRGEAKFDSLEALVEQMDKDCEQARKVLTSRL